METFVLVIAEPADASSAQAARAVNNVVENVLTRPGEQFVYSQVAGVLPTVSDRVIPELLVEGIPTRLDPDDRQTIDEIVDYLYRKYGTGHRYYLSTLIENRRARLTAKFTGDTPPSEPGVPEPPLPYSPAARDAELAALDRLAEAATAAWDRMYLGLGVLLDFVDASARSVMREEIDKARALAAYEKYGLVRDEKQDQATVANPGMFKKLADGLRRLARLREELRAMETAETVAGLNLFAALLYYFYQGSGSVFDDPGVQQTGGRQDDAARARIAAANAYAKELRTLATTFPLAWRLEDDLSSRADDDKILKWAVKELQRVHEALDEIERGAVLRASPRFTTQDPLATVVDDARATWSVWQYAQVVSLGLAGINQKPGTLAWCAAMEALGRIAAQRAPREEDGGWLFAAAVQVGLLIPGVGEVVLVLDILVAAVSAYQRIAEAEHQRTAHLAGLDPVSVLAVPDVPLGAIVVTSLLSVGLAVFASGHARKLVGLIDFQHYANRLLWVCRKFCQGAWILGNLTGGGSMQVAYRNRAVITLVEASQRQAIRELGDIFLEVRAGAEAATGAAGTATQAAGGVAGEAVDPEVNRIIAALMAVSGTAAPASGSQGATAPQSQGGEGSPTQPPAPGATSTTPEATFSRSIPDIEELVQNPALLAHTVEDVTTMLRLGAPGIPSDGIENRDFVRTLVLQLLNAYRQYTSTYTLRRQLAEGVTLEEARTLDVDGIVNHIAGKVNELLAVHYGGLTARLMAEAKARYAVAQPGAWEYPKLAAQLEIDTGKGYRLAQDLAVYSRGIGPNQGLIRLWAWGQITFGDPMHLLVQTESDFHRFGTPGARMRIDGAEYDVGMQVVGDPPLPGSAAAANTAIIGAATRAPSADVASGLAAYGVISHRLPWTSDELRMIVREVLRRANKLGQ